MTFHLINASSFSQHETLLEDFGIGLYQEAFPDPDEREPFEQIVSRIREAKANEPEESGLFPSALMAALA